ncbi:MAG TPA: preprotein translocase subunit YajC, partial [Polyangiaceae bacterium]|nr:preprotein translocase subunit YajC [Polyangiaceae bacterium]
MSHFTMDLQTVPDAPGRGEAPQPAQHTESAAPPTHGDAPPVGAGGPFGGMGMLLIMFLPMILIIFLLNRSNSKKQRELESKLKKGDRVITSGGIIGRLVEISPNSKYIKLEVTSGVKIEMLKSAIQGLDTGDVAALSKDTSDKTDKDK